MKHEKKGTKKHEKAGDNHHADLQKGETRQAKSHNHGHPHQQPTQEKSNPNLLKRDLKRIEKLHAKVEYLEIREEYDEADKLREQITAIEENANEKARLKAEKAAWSTAERQSHVAC